MRSCPYSPAELASGIAAELAAGAGVSVRTVSTWRQQSAPKGRPGPRAPRLTPEATRAALVARLAPEVRATATDGDIARAWGVARGSVWAALANGVRPGTIERWARARRRAPDAHPEISAPDRRREE